MKIITVTILVSLLGIATAGPIPLADDYVAGFVLYKVEDGKIEYVLLQKSSELDDWSPPKGNPFFSLLNLRSSLL